MRIKQIYKKIFDDCVQLNSVFLHKFIIYNIIDENITGNLYKLSKQNYNIKYQTVIFPICIRQPYYSHMILCWIKDTVLFYFDPSNEDIYDKIIRYIKDHYSYSECRRVYNKTVEQDNKFDCTFLCYKQFVINIKNGSKSIY